MPGEVAKYLAENGLEHERARGITGRSLSVWNVDFHVRTVGRSSLVYVLNTGSRTAANRITDHVVAAWYDLTALGNVVWPLTVMLDSNIENAPAHLK